MSPLASPACGPGSPLTAPMVSDTNARPSPAPTSSEGPRIPAVNEVATVTCASQASPVANRARPPTSVALTPGPGDEPGGDPGSGDGGDRQRKLAQARSQRAVIQHLLFIQGQDEEQAQHGGAGQQHDHVGSPQRARPEDGERHQRPAAPPLDDDERCQQHRGQGEGSGRTRRPPRGLARAEQPVDQGTQPAGHDHGARYVKSLSRAGSAALGDQPGRGQRAADADRHVDEQDRPPAQGGGEHAAEQHAGRGAPAGHRSPDPHRAVALVALGERGGDQ